VSSQGAVPVSAPHLGCLSANIEAVARDDDRRKPCVRGRDAQHLPHDLFVGTGLDDRAIANDSRPPKPQKPRWRRTPLDPWNVPMRVQIVAGLPLGVSVLTLWLLPKLFIASWGWHTAEPWCGLLALLYWPPTSWWLIRRYRQPNNGEV
jgi:hypothetical protein